MNGLKSLKGIGRITIDASAAEGYLGRNWYGYFVFGKRNLSPNSQLPNAQNSLLMWFASILKNSINNLGVTFQKIRLGKSFFIKILISYQ
jgi:hypothetical protein